MSNKPHVEIQELSIKYRILHNQAKSLKETLINFVKRKSIVTLHEALRDINLKIYEGETLAILGRNGAGKSTLLKTIARVLPPTSGRVITRGRVAPLIELGAGFHPDMTGRENAILYGTILGQTPTAMRNRIDGIAEWAGIGKFLDLPVRTYSSGMVARLSFAVATDQHPDILIVDEVLSVGDADFQKRSLARLLEVIERSSCVIFTSHDLAMIKKLATNIIWLDGGEVKEIGPANSVLERYQSSF